MIPLNTKLILSRWDFVYWDFRIIGQDLFYKRCNSLQTPKAVVYSINIILVIYMNIMLVVYINIKKKNDKEIIKSMKNNNVVTNNYSLPFDSDTSDLSFRILKIFFIKRDGNFFEACFIF